MGARVYALAAVVAVVAVVGCGSSNRGPTTTAAQKPNGEAAKPAAQILADTAAALAKVHTFRVTGGGVDVNGGALKLELAFALPGRMRVQLSEGSAQVAFVLDRGAGYLKANVPFWTGQAVPAAAAARLAGRWITVSPGNAGMAEFAAWANPATIGHCLIESHLGAVSVVGTSTYHGQPVVVLRDHGNLPGSTPSELYVATTGPPLALRLVQTAPVRPGGTPDRECGERSVAPGTTKHSVVRISAYNQPVQIVAPRGAATVSAVLGSAG